MPTSEHSSAARWNAKEVQKSFVVVYRAEGEFLPAPPCGCEAVVSRNVPTSAAELNTGEVFLFSKHSMRMCAAHALANNTLQGVACGDPLSSAYSQYFG